MKWQIQTYEVETANIKLTGHISTARREAGITCTNHRPLSIREVHRVEYRCTILYTKQQAETGAPPPCPAQQEVYRQSTGKIIC